MRAHVMTTLVVAASAVGAGRADAFQIETSATRGCHEAITRAAIHQVGWPGGAAPPAADDTELRVAGAVPFTIPDGDRDPWTLSALIGVRFSDIHDHAPTHINELVHIHNDPDDQPAHCMRMAGHDGSEGDAQALATCRDFIMGQLELALGQGDELGLDQRIDVDVYLAFQGTTRVSVSRYAFHVGRALHALQDSYTHAMRAPGDGRVRHVMNWIEFARDPGYVDDRDGFGHIAGLDDCTRDDEVNQAAAARATLASAKLLAALAAARADRDKRLQQAGAVLDEVFAIEPGCVRANDYCDAPELEVAGGCSAGGPASGAGWMVVVLVVGLSLRRRTRVGVVAVVLLVVSGAGSARADVREGRQRPLALSASVGASFDNGAGAASVGLRWFPTATVGLAATLEYNPWFSLDAGRTAAGAANGYASVMVTHRDVGGWKLRSSASVGGSVLLFDMVGVDRGAVGLYLGASLISVVAPVSDSVSLVIEPASIAMPVPHTSGMPFYYRQYRTSIGVEWAF